MPSLMLKLKARAIGMALSLLAKGYLFDALRCFATLEAGPYEGL